jgi:hypothetical protein
VKEIAVVGFAPYRDQEKVASKINYSNEWSRI